MIALAALLTLMAACGLRSPNPSDETLTVYQDAPAMNPLDLGPPGNSPGDAYYFSAPLHSSRSGPVMSEVFGSKTLIKLPTDAKSNSFEQRATLLIFTFGSNSDDQIVVMGVPDYPPNAAEVNAGRRKCALLTRPPVGTSVESSRIGSV
jgi:hypothetical protein